MSRYYVRAWTSWVILCVGLCLASCAKQVDTSHSTGADAPAVGTGIDEDQRALALAAKDDLFQKLSGRLMEVMMSEGPTAAIAVCSQEAVEITRQVGESKGVKIGRTSFRLRNSKNLPPSWATGLIQQRVEKPQFVNLPNNELGALLPIRLQVQCLLCHGPKENIPDEVKQALARSYPEDQATGFEVDAIRGWFWVEVPGESSE